MPDFLDVDNAFAVVDVISSMLPDAKQVGVRNGMQEMLRTWPHTDWLSVLDRLRNPALDMSKIADWLEEELAAENEHRQKIGALSLGPKT